MRVEPPHNASALEIARPLARIGRPRIASTQPQRCPNARMARPSSFRMCGLKPDLKSSYCPTGFARKTLGRFEEVIRPRWRRNVTNGDVFFYRHLEFEVAEGHPGSCLDKLRGRVRAKTSLNRGRKDVDIVPRCCLYFCLHAVRGLKSAGPAIKQKTLAIYHFYYKLWWRRRSTEKSLLGNAV